MFLLIKSWSCLKMGHFGSKTRSNLLKKPCVHSRGHIFSPIIMKVCQNFVFMKSRTGLNMGHFGSKTRSLAQTLEKPCLCFRDQIFSLILMKLVQSFCLDKTLYIFENGSYWVKNQVTRSNRRRSYACNQGVVI